MFLFLSYTQQIQLFSYAFNTAKWHHLRIQEKSRNEKKKRHFQPLCIHVYFILSFIAKFYFNKV